MYFQIWEGDCGMKHVAKFAVPKGPPPIPDPRDDTDSGRSSLRRSRDAKNRVYVATAFANKQRAREVMDKLVSFGYEITYDWTIEEDDRIEGQIDELKWIRNSLRDARAVDEADLLILLAEDGFVYCSALAEFGMALGQKKPVYVIGNALNDRMLFLRHPLVRRGMPRRLK